jgi:hypothetical protein
VAAVRNLASWGCGTWSVERNRLYAFHAAISGKTFKPGLEEPPMFKMPAYDPVGIAMLGFGVLAVVALAFAF